MCANNAWRTFSAKPTAAFAAKNCAVTELMSLAKKHVSTSSSIEPYIIAMLMYLLFNGIAEQVCRLVERKLSYYQ